MRQTVDILGINIDTLNKTKALETILAFVGDSSTKIVFTPNSEMIMIAHTDDELKTTLNSSDLLIADGIGIVWASKILGYSIPERVTGYDTMSELFKIGNKGSFSFYLLGSSQEVIERTVHNLKTMYTELNILGYHNGYFDSIEEINIIEEINKLKPDILFVALGAPKQEKWIYRNKTNINAKVCMGVGGCFDVIAGKVKRAPIFFQKFGLEWLYRLFEQPTRFKRMLKLPQFGLYVIMKKIGLID